MMSRRVTPVVVLVKALGRVIRGGVEAVDGVD